MRLFLFFSAIVFFAPSAFAQEVKPQIEFKVLLIIKKDSDSYSPLFLPIRSSMTDSEIDGARHCFEVETPDMVNEITNGKVRLTPTVLISKKPLRIFDPKRLDSAEYYPSEMLNELQANAKTGKYDSVGYYFLHYDAASGYTIPRAGYGVGGFDTNHCLGTFAVNCTSKMNPRDEIFLHEWMHGLDGYFGNKPGVKLPQGALHGGGSHGYQSKAWRPEDTFQGWMSWYKDYFNGTVQENGQPTGLGDVAWEYGPMRLEAKKVDRNYRTAKLPLQTYPPWVYELMKGDLSHAVLGPTLLDKSLEPEKLSKTSAWRLEIWDPNAETKAEIISDDHDTLIISNPRPNATSVTHAISLQPFANYLFSAEVRTENVQITEKGGQYSVNLYAGDSTSTKDMSGTNSWTTLSLPFTTGEKADSYNVKLGLGGFASVTKGKAYFKNVQVRKIGYPIKDIKPQK